MKRIDFDFENMGGLAELYAIPRQSPSLAVVHNLRDRHVLHIHPALSGDDFRPSGSWQTGSPRAESLAGQQRIGLTLCPRSHRRNIHLREYSLQAQGAPAA